MFKKWVLSAIVIMFMLVPFSKALAHSPIEKRIPERNAILETSPVKIELFFEEPVEIHRSSIIVRNDKQNEMQIGRPQLAPDDNKHVSIGLQSNLLPGTYTVEVDVVSIDGHGLKETYSFEIKQPPRVNQDNQTLTLIRTLPDDGSILDASLKRIELWYSSPAELSVFGLLDDKQHALDTKKPVADPEDPKHFTVELDGELREGTYSIVSYAKQDDKEDYKINYFAVKKVTSITGAAAKSNDAIWKHIKLLQVAHWLSYIGVIVLVGASWFQTIINGRKHSNPHWRKCSLYLYGCSAAAILLELISNKVQYSEVVLSDFITFSFVWIQAIQLLLLFLSYFVKWKEVKLILLTLVLFCFALTGHSVAPPYGGIFGVVLDFLHLFAGSLWAGGLFILFFTVPKENTSDWIRETATIFSKWALGSIIVIGVSGVWMTFNYVPSFTLTSMLQSFWGEVLLVKIVLYAGIIVIGYWQRKLLLRFAEPLISVFRRVISLEIIVASVILFLAGVLVDLSPQEAAQGIVPTKQIQQGIKANIRIAPLQAGANDITVGFNQAADIQKVRVRFYSTNGWSAENSAFWLGDGSFKLTGSFFHGAGTLNMDIQAIKSNGETVVFPYKVQVPGIMNTNNS